MTFEEIQKIIEGMLAVQRNIQDADLRLQEKLDRVAEQQLKSDLKLDSHSLMAITRLPNQTD
jgi:hypothetical protein